MPLTIEDQWLPGRATSHPLPNAEFAELVSHHPDLFFETTALPVLRRIRSWRG